jgi:predicted DCC family thiol-disulfide oxidoreductase YuxK
MCDPKEPFYFSHDSIYALGPAWYRGLFARCGEDRLCGEASTSYSVYPTCGDVAGRIAQAIPDAKLIYIMRHPVERTYSGYDHLMVRLGAKLTFEDALTKHPGLLSASMYMQQIRQYLTHFDRKDLLCLLLTDLVTSTEETLNTVCRFLGIRSATLDLVSLDNSGREHFVRQHTTQRLRKIPGVSFVTDRVPRPWRDAAFGGFKASPVYRWIAQRHQLPTMSPKTRQRLLGIFEKPNQELAEFLERDLSHWAV